MQNKRILVVDDEIDLCEILKFNLESNGFEVKYVNSGEDALKENLDTYDLFIFDVMMYGINGFDLLKLIRLQKKIITPVVFISALTDEESIVNGLQIGADDYIKKPFMIKEVIARVNKILERSNKNLNTPNSNYKLTLDTMKKRVLIDNLPIDLTRKEYDLFTLLYNNPGKVYSRDEILDIIWSHEQFVLGRTVDVNVTRLRKKLGIWGGCIVTRSGYGYCFDDKGIEILQTQLKAV